jgi:hypothetical protein
VFANTIFVWCLDWFQQIKLIKNALPVAEDISKLNVT